MPIFASRIGTIEQPNDQSRFHTDYLRGADTVLEIVTYDAATRHRSPQSRAEGSAAAVPQPPADVAADPDGFPLTLDRVPVVSA